MTHYVAFHGISSGSSLFANIPIKGFSVYKGLNGVDLDLDQTAHIFRLCCICGLPIVLFRAFFLMTSYLLPILKMRSQYDCNVQSSCM